MEVVWFAQVHPPGGAGLPVTPEPPSTVSGACFGPGAALGTGDPEGTPLSSEPQPRTKDNPHICLSLPRFTSKRCLIARNRARETPVLFPLPSSYFTPIHTHL